MATHSPAAAVAGLPQTARKHGGVLDVVQEWITTVDHKKIGLMYIGYALIFLVVAGIEALLMRIQLAVPNNHFVSPETFNRLFTMHGTTTVSYTHLTLPTTERV